MKKALSILLAVTLIFSITITGYTTVNAEQSGDFTYEIVDDYASISGYTGAGGEVTIPESLGGYTVYAIAFNGFMGNKLITKINIPKTIGIVTPNVFNGCTSLTEIFVDAENETLSSENGVLFSNAEGVKDILIRFPIGKSANYSVPDTITYIEESAFEGCTGLTGITLPENIDCIGNYAFKGCREITSITLPDSLTGIGMAAFKECVGLTDITIPANVLEIGDSAFNSCSGITEFIVDSSNEYFSNFEGVLFDKDKAILIQCPAQKSGIYTIPNTVDTLYYGSFSECSKLTTVSIPKNVTDILNNPFEGCDLLTQINAAGDNPNYSSVGGVLFNKSGSIVVACPGGISGSYTIPGGVSEIGNYAFSLCEKLTEITLPNGLFRIGDRAFNGCIGITQIEFPNVVTSIGERIFNNCSELDAINVDNTNLDFSSVDGVLFDYNKTALILCPAGKVGRYTIPEGVIVIRADSFATCEKLTEVVMPAGIDMVGALAFESCSELSAVYFLGDAPQTVYDFVFSSCAPTFKIFYLKGNNTFSNPWYGYETAEFETLPATPTLTASPTPTATTTPTGTPTPTATPTPTVTPTPTATPVAVASVKISKTALSIKVAQTVKLTATVYPLNATNKTVKWKSSNTKVATVSSTGYIKGIVKGAATITVTTVNGAKIATCKVTVIQPVKSVTINKKTLTLKKGSKYRLIATVLPANSNNKKVTWKSSNKSIATVTSTGIVKGIKKGTTYINVYTVDGKKTARCKITVK